MRDYVFPLLRRWRFLQLSILLLLILFISPYMRDSKFYQILLQILMLNSLLVTLSAAAMNRRLRSTLWALWLIAAMASSAELIISDPLMRVLALRLELICLAILLLGCVVQILIFVFHNLRASMDSIFAAFTAYLLLANAFALLFTLVWSSDHSAFNFSQHVPEGGNINSARVSLTYFSFVTIATLGYGDIVPISSLARSLATSEAVFGQFYVAVVVAMLVGSLSTQVQASPGSELSEAQKGESKDG